MEGPAGRGQPHRRDRRSDRARRSGLLDDPRDLDAYGAAVAGSTTGGAAAVMGEAARERVRQRFLGTHSLLEYWPHRAPDRRTVTAHGMRHRRLLARRELPVGRADLPARQPAAARAADARARQAAAARPLGHDAGPEPALRAHEPRDPARDLNAIYVTGPGHGGPASSPTPTWRAPTARSTRRSARTRRGCAGCSGSSPSRAASRATSRPETPGSIHEGGELGYALVHAYGAAFDNPDLLALCVVGDGEAETGPLAASWHSNKFVNPARDGAVLPVLHLNGYKIANPTVLARGSRATSCARCSRATATRRVRRGRRSRGRCTRRWPRRSTARSTRSPRSRSARAAAAASARAGR